MDIGYAPGDRCGGGEARQRASFVCKNSALAEEHTRNDLLDTTEQDLKDIQARIVRQRQRLRGADKIGRAVGALLDCRKVAKHFRITITDSALSFMHDHAAIAAEAALRTIGATPLCLYRPPREYPSHSYQSFGAGPATADDACGSGVRRRGEV